MILLVFTNFYEVITNMLGIYICGKLQNIENNSKNYGTLI